MKLGVSELVENKHSDGVHSVSAAKTLDVIACARLPFCLTEDSRGDHLG